MCLYTDVYHCCVYHIVVGEQIVCLLGYNNGGVFCSSKSNRKWLAIGPVKDIVEGG